MPLPSLSRRALLGSLAVAALLPGGPVRAQPAGQGHRPPGWDPQVEGPREATLHVAPQGDDASPGSAQQPLRSLARGVALLAEHKTGSLSLHAGIYREAVDLSALRGAVRADGSPAYRLHRHGRDRVVISGADLLRGWEPCPPAQAARLGLPREGVHRARLPFTALAHGSLWALNLHEDGVYCPPAGWRASREKPTALYNAKTMRRADFGTEGAQRVITSVRDPALVGCDPELLREARVLIYHNPNRVTAVVPKGFDPATGTLQLPPEPALRLHQRGEVAEMLYALQNVPLALEQGDWYARRAADQVEIYFWPRDPARLETAVEVSLRDHCVDFGTASSVELFGLEMIRASGAQRSAGSCVRRSLGRQAPGGEDLRLVQCRLGENLGAEGAGYGALHLRHAVRPVLRNCTIEACRNHVGLALDECRDADLRHLEVREISRSGARFFGLKGGILAFSRFEDTGWDAHSNKFHFYLGSDRILVYGVRTQNTAGYVTYQEASRIHFAFCDFDADVQAQGRAGRWSRKITSPASGATPLRRTVPVIPDQAAPSGIGTCPCSPPGRGRRGGMRWCWAPATAATGTGSTTAA